jgi:hypothetical protein
VSLQVVVSSITVSSYTLLSFTSTGGLELYAVVGFTITSDDNLVVTSAGFKFDGAVIHLQKIRLHQAVVVAAAGHILAQFIETENHH